MNHFKDTRTAEEREQQSKRVAQITAENLRRHGVRFELRAPSATQSKPVQLDMVQLYR